MSNFLSNLVERSVAVTAAVRPQLFSIFEPLSTGAGSVFRDENLETKEHKPAALVSPLQSSGNPTFESTPGTQTAPTVAPTPERAGALGASRVAPPVDLLGKRQQEAPPSARPEFTGAVKVEGVSASDWPRASPQMPRPTEPSGKRESAPSRRENHRAADAAEKIEQGAVEIRPRVPPEPRLRGPGPAELPADSTNERLPALRPEKIVELPVREPGARREPMPKVRPMYALVPRPRSPWPLDLMAPEKNPAPAPIINVTIGRVEVRATRPSPARPPAATAPAPIMSLDEYLRQRAGGHRS